MTDFPAYRRDHVGVADGQQSARHRLVGRGPHDVDIQRDDLPTPVR
jgi:hypothetical protein